jgi:hypothetical protein
VLGVAASIVALTRRQDRQGRLPRIRKRASFGPY